VAQLYIAAPLTPRERADLKTGVTPLLPPSLPSNRADAVIAELEHATAHAKPSIEYRNVAKMEKSAARSMHRMMKYNRQPLKDWARAIHALKPSVRYQFKPRGGGRARHTINGILMRDIVDIFRRFGVERPWKTGSEGRLALTYRVCAGVAKLPIPRELRASGTTLRKS
jgi:hypothetical protein